MKIRSFASGARFVARELRAVRNNRAMFEAEQAAKIAAIAANVGRRRARLIVASVAGTNLVTVRLTTARLNHRAM